MKKLFFILFFYSFLLVGCQWLWFSQEKDNIFTRGIPGLSNWMILPFRTESKIEDYQIIQCERTMRVQLPSFGIPHAKMISSKERNILLSYDKEDFILESLKIAQSKGMKFAVTSEIKKWKTYEYGHNELELSITIYNVENNKPVWHINGRRETSKYENLLSVYRDLIIDLLKLMPVADYK